MARTENFSYQPLAMATTFLLGIAAGSAIAMLTAPRSGAETRSRIKEGVDEGKKKITQASNELRGKANAIVEDGKRRVTGEADRISHAIEVGVDSYRKSTSGANGLAKEPILNRGFEDQVSI